MPQWLVSFLDVLPWLWDKTQSWVLLQCHLERGCSAEAELYLSISSLARSCISPPSWLLSVSSPPPLLPSCRRSSCCCCRGGGHGRSNGGSKSVDRSNVPGRRDASGSSGVKKAAGDAWDGGACVTGGGSCGARCVCRHDSSACRFATYTIKKFSVAGDMLHLTGNYHKI